VSVQTRGVGQKTRSSIVMVKTVQSLYTKHAMELLLFQQVHGIAENASRRNALREFVVNSAHLVMAP
jgi:hypothetical protein